MKICVVTPLFAIAGVPLAQVRFARALAAKGHGVELLIGHIHPDCVFEPPAGFKTTVMNQPNVRSMIWPLVRYLRTEKPDVVFSAEDHLTAIVLLACILSNSHTKVSGSSRVAPIAQKAYSEKWFAKGWWLKQIMSVVMWRADALTCVSKDMVEHYKELFTNPPHVCVYNIIKDSNAMRRAGEKLDNEWFVDKTCPIIIGAGTMTKRKGFNDLIEAFSIVRANRPCRLLILGDGYLRDDLSSLVARLGLNDCVKMPGNVDNPLKYFAKSDVFVLSSYAEGLPNALVEAMMCGCTPVSTDCPTGPRELLQDGKYGYLVPMRDPVAMAAAIERALDNPTPRALLDEAVAPFEENAVIERHFEVLGLQE